MYRPSNLGQLPTAVWQRLQELTDHFEQAWEEAQNVDLALFLPDETDPLFAVALHELIKTDLEYRWRRGLPVILDYYLERFAQLGSTQTLSPQLIYEEYRIRLQHGDQPSMDTYRRRFPEQFPALERLIRERTPVTHSSTFHPKADGGPAPPPGPRPPAPASAEADLPKFRPPTMLPVGGGYKLLERIGQGAFGEVWKAEAPGGIEVAIKIIHQPLDQEMAQREQQALDLIKGLRHSYLTQTHASWSLQDRLYIVMELADCSLRDRLLECRKRSASGIPIDELLPIFKEVAEALDYLHSEQLLHRDIKPENILLVHGHAKLADFGLTRVLEGRGLMTVSFAGTPPYMAPEIFKGKVNARSEQYSLAATYAELRLDHRIFSAGSMVEMMLQHLQAEPELTGLPEPERQVVLRALAKDNESRFENCQAFVQALEKVRGKIDDETKKAGPGWTRRLFLTAGVAAAAGVGTAVWYVIRPKADWVPDGCKPAEGASLVADGNGRNYYNRIILNKGELSIPFVLVPYQKQPGPRMSTFYIMGNKVSNDLFLEAWQDTAFKEVLARHERPYPNVVKEEWKRGGLASGRDLGVGNLRHPILGISVLEAYSFAVWLGGHLPSRDQWDKAAGRWDDDRPGPYDPAWDTDPRQSDETRTRIAVGRAAVGPEEVGQSYQDVCRLGVRDLAGNGREWTRTLYLVQGEVPLQDPQDQDDRRVLLRGRSHTDLGPLRFEELERLEKAKSVPSAVKLLTIGYLHTERDIGFRVVLEQR